MNYPIVRFAPSPTGYLHIGGARTALFNWLFTRKHQGKFLLRIEDTDLERSEEKYIDQIISALDWLGLDHDGDYILQSNNLSSHQAALDQLLAQGKAYRCFYSKEELDQLRLAAEKAKKPFRVPTTYRDLSQEELNKHLQDKKEFTIRLKVPEGETSFEDLVFGNITVQNREIDDFILARSDGSPTYNFVVTIDDADMKITHVIRGDDHLANTPKQILIYEALSLPVPTFVHLPMILGSDGKRLSKRHAATNVQEYKEKGYQPKSIINYLSLLGWNPDSNEEIFSINEIIEQFELNQIQKKPAIFDEKKLNWVSGQHLQKSSIKELIEAIKELDLTWAEHHSEDFVKKLLLLLRDRSKNIQDIIELGNIIMSNPSSYSQDELHNIFKGNNFEVIENFISGLEAEEFTQLNIEQLIDNISIQCELSLGAVMKQIRFAITTITYGPSLVEIIILLGQDTIISRLKKFVQHST